jgi:AcrR family transcriptional regulator
VTVARVTNKAPREVGITPPPAESTSATADDIRRAARRLFASTGYDATTMRAIASAVGIRAASLYNHFPSKEEILWDLTLTALTDLEASWADVARALPSDAEALDRLGAFVRTHVAFHAMKGQEAVLVNSQMDRLSPEHRKSAIVMRDRYQRRLSDIIQRGIDDGSFGVPNVRVTTFAILQIGVGVSTWFKPTGQLTVDDLCDIYEELAARMVTEGTQ